MGLFDLPPAQNIRFMLVERLCKRVTAGPVGNEIEVLGTRRVGHRFERRYGTFARTVGMSPNATGRPTA